MHDASLSIETARVKARYNRIAPSYDRREALAERWIRPWRERLWHGAGGRVLEVGVGTGKNVPFYPSAAVATAIDLSGRMAELARQRVRHLSAAVEVEEGDVQDLQFPAGSFDTAVATFVFCSVPDPIRGLRELARVVRPGGRILLLEHVRIDRPVIGRLMDLLDPLIVRLSGAHINRRTVENVARAGLVVEAVEHLGPMGVVKLIVAQPAA